MLLVAGFVVAILAPLVAIAAISVSRYAPLPTRRLLWTVILCALTTVVTVFASAIVVNLMTAPGTTDGLAARAGSTWRVLPVLALLEELSRFVVLAGYALGARFTRTGRDGIMLGLAAGLTFALLENILTSMGPGAGSSASGWIRFAMATPLHALLGALMGYLIVRARAQPAERFWRLLEAILLPTAIHICYDAPVILAVAHWSEEMTLEIAGLAVTLSAGVELALAWAVWRLFSAPATQPPPSRIPPAT